jgi:hypothetical protein
MTYQRFGSSPDTVLDLLNNALVLGPFPTMGLRAGKQQLVFTSPAATIDLPGDEGALVSLSEIIRALREQVPGLHADLREITGQSAQRRLSLYRDEGFILGKGGSANRLFGIDQNADTEVRAPIPLENVKSAARTSPNEYEVLIGGADDLYMSAPKK